MERNKALLLVEKLVIIGRNLRTLLKNWHCLKL